MFGFFFCTWVGLEMLFVNVVCLSLVTWKKNNNVESPTSPEHRRPSKRVRISVVVRATDLGAWKPPGNRSISQSADCHPIIPS